MNALASHDLVDILESETLDVFLKQDNAFRKLSFESLGVAARL
jgi:hypothetical protein